MGDGECRRAGVGRGHHRLGALVGDGERDGARAGAEVEDARGGPARARLAQHLEHRLDQTLGLVPRDEHCRAHGEVEPAEGGAPGDVLDRLAAEAPLEPGLEPLPFLRAELSRALQIELGAREAEQAAEQLLGVGPRRIARHGQPRGRAREGTGQAGIHAAGSVAERRRPG